MRNPAVAKGVAYAMAQEIANERIRVRREGGSDADVQEAIAEVRRRYRELFGTAATETERPVSS